jgi:1-acyl-sn-glycerol-3-phosphate acyltransferase
VNRVEALWPLGRYSFGWLGALTARVRYYGSDRIPRKGGVVLALNHFSWIDIPCFGVACPRNTYFVAKVEAHKVPGLGQFIRTFGAISVRRGESDREAVRRMREVVREGGVLGLFVEGTRQRSGVPGDVQPGAAMVALQEDVPVVCGAIHGTQDYRLGNFAPATVAWGEPIRFEGLPRGAKGYRAASAEIQAEIHRLWSWAKDVHEAGRPRHAVPPSAPAHLRAPVTLPR